MHATIILGSLCALVAHTATAAAAPPSWCKGGPNKPTYFLSSLYTEASVDRALIGIVAASCYPGEDVANQEKQLAALRDAWSKKLSLVEADWTDVSEWAHLPQYLRGDPKIAVTDRQAAWTAYSPLDQYGDLITGNMGQEDAAYLADAFGAKLTQLGRLGYVAYCVDQNSQDPAVRWAMCATDAEQLDLGKIAAEIRGDATHGAGDRMAARITAYEVITQKLPTYFADTKALRAKDPAYEKMFALGKAAHAQWAATDARWIALASELDDARITGSRSASAGCIAKTWEAWKSVVAAVPAKRLAAIHPEPGNQFAQQLVAAVVGEANGYLASLTFNECAQLESKPDYLSRVIGHAIGRWPGLRGPRTATQTAILVADLKLDKRGAKIDFPEVKRPWIVGDGGTSTSGLGGIESVKIEGERATVTFAKQKVTQTRCTKGHFTSRISQIMSDGTVVYYYVCDTEITETIEVPPSPPMRVGARYATGLKKGMTVEIIDDVAVVAYPKGKGTPVIVTGIEVK
jgi:hypothetical protein